MTEVMYVIQNMLKEITFGLLGCLILPNSTSCVVTGLILQQRLLPVKQRVTKVDFAGHLQWNVHSCTPFFYQTRMNSNRNAVWKLQDQVRIQRGLKRAKMKGEMADVFAMVYINTNKVSNSSRCLM
jgi:hypothetical protein